MRKLIVGWLPFAVAAAALFGASAAHAQFTSGSGTSTSNFSGNSSGGSSSGRSNGSSSTGGAFSGTSSRTGSGSTAYGTSSFLGNYYANPLAFGLPTQAQVSSLASIAGSGTTGSSGSSGSGNSSVGGTSSMNAFSSTGTSTNNNSTASVPFGTPLYTISTAKGTATITTTTPNLQPSTSPLRTSYSVQVGFTPPSVSLTNVMSDYKAAIQQSPDLSKVSNRIQPVLDGNVLILRGEVQTEREKYLAFVLAKMSPGIRDVRNELAVRDTGTAELASR